MCKGGIHKRPNPHYHYLIGKDGNPPRTHPPDWCTNCPLANWEFKEQFKVARGRRYAKLNKAKSGYTRYNEGDVVKAATDWMVAIGICPADSRYSHNSGRKALARLLSHFNVPYDIGFEIHGDKWCVWQGNYQFDCAFSSMERRNQHRDPDRCCAALRKIANGFGLGIIKAKPMTRQEKFMHAILQSINPQLAETIRTGINTLAPAHEELPPTVAVEPPPAAEARLEGARRVPRPPPPKRPPPRKRKPPPKRPPPRKRKKTRRRKDDDDDNQFWSPN